MSMSVIKTWAEEERRKLLQSEVNPMAYLPKIQEVEGLSIRLENGRRVFDWRDVEPGAEPIFHGGMIGVAARLPGSAMPSKGYWVIYAPIVSCEGEHLGESPIALLTLDYSFYLLSLEGWSAPYIIKKLSWGERLKYWWIGSTLRKVIFKRLAALGFRVSI